MKLLLPSVQDTLLLFAWSSFSTLRFLFNSLTSGFDCALASSSAGRSFFFSSVLASWCFWAVCTAARVALRVRFSASRLALAARSFAVFRLTSAL